MKEIVALVRERSSENEKWTDYFLVENAENPEENFRAAIREYLLTDVGTESIKATSEDFNWGDSVLYVPDHIWNKHGIREIEDGEKIVFSHPFVIEVNQDEILIPEEYYQIN